MITVKEKTTIAAISELRNNSEEIIRALKENQVILERHKKPVAVMLDYERYEQLKVILDYAEDYILGSVALERDKSAKKSDFIDIDKW